MTDIRRTGTHTIAALTQRAFLSERLADAVRNVRSKQVAIAFSYAGESAHTAVGVDCEPEAFATPTGCLTKLFTAALAQNACSAGWFRRDDRILDLLGRSAAGARADVLDGVTVRHLLEHTHGLDDSLIACVPRAADGYIDAGVLRTKLSSVRRLAAPGELYSYANVGAWLVAAALERRGGRGFGALLHDRLLIQPAAAPEHGGICPSLGDTLMVSMTDMLRFVRVSALGTEQQWPAGDGCAQVTPLPGWSALERGVYLGWKYYGAGWFGHNSTWPGASALVRIQPEHGIAFVIASRELPAVIVAAKVFGRVFPELVDLRIPAALDDERAGSLDSRRYAGLYRSAALTVEIARAGSGLAIILSRRRADAAEGSVHARAMLRAAAHDVFFVQAAAIDSFAYVQFIAPRGDHFEYLWNGRFVLRRVS